MDTAIKLGAQVKDKVTGFQGVATGLVTYISGCIQVLVQPPVDEKGAAREAQWFDEQRLEQVGTTVIELDNGKTPGFDRQAPRR